MATEDERNRLTDSKIAILADKISTEDMEQLAEGYLEISRTSVKNARRDDPAASNRELLHIFRNKGNDILVSSGSLESLNNLK